MSQQINLFLPALQPRRDWLSFNAVAAWSVLLIVLCLGLWVALAQRVANLAAEDAAVQTELKAAQADLGAKTVALAGRKPDAALLVQIATAESELKLREEALRVIESGQAGNDAGFSASLRALSQQTVPGVWLTGFVLHPSELELRGRLTDPALLPLYIRRLNSESAFRDRRFAELDVQRGELPRGENAPRDAAPVRAGFVDFALRAQPDKGATGEKPR